MKFLFIALLTALPAIVFGQTNFHEGYVLKNNGDTLKGYINYREWAYSPTSIEFKRGNAGDVTKFGPGDIKSFQINGFENYVSYLGLASVNKNIFPDLPSNLDTARKQMVIFLKEVVSGNNVTLYYNNEQNKKRFFIAETNQPPAELKYYEYYAIAGSEEIFDNLFRGQLILLTNKFKNGNQKLLNSIAKARYEETDLRSITTLLNDENVGKSAISANMNIRPRSVRVFAGLGANDITTTYKYNQSVVSTINDNGTSTVYNEAVYHSTTIAPKINFGLDIFINPNVQQFIFRSELSFSYSNGYFNRPVESITGNYTTYNLKFTQYTTSLTPQLLFNLYNTDKLKFYIDGGITLNLSSYGNRNSAENNQSPLELQSFWAYFPFQAGVVFNKRTEIYFTYTTGASFSNYTDFSVSNQFMCLGLKVLFH
jgi:hypothetical protein